jgi:hypothetical protein
MRAYRARMKISHLLGMAGFAMLAAISPARADSLPSPSAVTVKVGGSLQSNGGDTSGFAAGLDYVLHPSSVLEPVNVSAYADLLGRGVGAGLAIRNAGPVYAGAGLGLYSVSSVAGLGGKVFGGFNIAPRTSLELGYHFLPQIDGVRENAVTLAVGLHL